MSSQFLSYRDALMGLTPIVPSNATAGGSAAMIPIEAVRVVHGLKFKKDRVVHDLRFKEERDEVRDSGVAPNDHPTENQFNTTMDWTVNGPHRDNSGWYAQEEIVDNDGATIPRSPSPWHPPTPPTSPYPWNISPRGHRSVAPPSPEIATINLPNSTENYESSSWPRRGRRAPRRRRVNLTLPPRPATPRAMIHLTPLPGRPIPRGPAPRLRRLSSENGAWVRDGEDVSMADGSIEEDQGVPDNDLSDSSWDRASQEHSYEPLLDPTSLDSTAEDLNRRTNIARDLFRAMPDDTFLEAIYDMARGAHDRITQLKRDITNQREEERRDSKIYEGHDWDYLELRIRELEDPTFSERETTLPQRAKHVI